MNLKKIRLAVGILSMNLLLMSGSTVGAAIAAIAKSFPKESISKVQMVSSISQLGQLVATLLFTWLTHKLTRKNIGILAVLIVAASGLLPAFYHSSLNIILACMVTLGFGVGLISNVSPVLLQEHFEGEDRAAVMGWAVGFNTIGMIGITLIGGILGSVHWENLFFVYVIALLVFLAFFFMVPQDVRIKNTDEENKASTSFLQTIKGLSKYVYIMLVITFITSLAVMIFMSNQSILLASKGYGTAYTASVTAIGNIGGILAAFGLKYIRKITKTNTMAWGFIAFVLSYVCIVFFANFPMHILGNMFSGIGIVMVNATIPFELSILADKKQFPLAIAMNTFMSSVAGMIAPMILAAINIAPGSSSYIAGIILCLATAVLLFISRLGSRIEKQHQAAMAQTE